MESSRTRLDLVRPMLKAKASAQLRDQSSSRPISRFALKVGVTCPVYPPNGGGEPGEFVKQGQVLPTERLPRQE